MEYPVTTAHAGIDKSLNLNVNVDMFGFRSVFNFVSNWGERISLRSDSSCFDLFS